MNSEDAMAQGNDDLLWDGWILNLDGSIHSSTVTEHAALPSPHGVLLRFNHAIYLDDAPAGPGRIVQIHLDPRRARQLANELWAFSDASPARAHG